MIDHDILAIYFIQLAKNLALSKDTLSKESQDNIAQLLQQLPKISNEPLKIWIYSELGWLYYTYNYYEKAYEYVLMASKTIEKSKSNSFIFAEDTFVHLSYFYFTIKDFEKSIYYSNKALTFLDESNSNYSALQNNLANVYFELQDYETASKYYKKAKEISYRNKDLLRYAKVLGDYAKYFMLNKNFDLAEELLLEDIRISKELNADRNTMFAQLRLASMYLSNQEIAKSKNLLQQAHSYAQTNPNLHSFNLELKTHLMQIALKEGDSKLELQLRRGIDSLQQLVREKDGPNIVEKINWKSQKEKVVWQLEAEKTKLENSRIIKQTFVVSSVLLLVSIILLILVFKKRFRLEKSLFENIILNHQLEKLQSEKALNDANNSLKSFKTYLDNKNKQINQLEDEYQNLKDQNSNLKDQQKESLESLLNSHLMTQDKWIIFKDSFIKEQPDYYKNLVDKFPNLTESNLRIILLQHLGLTNVEASKLLGITVDAVKKAKQRLRNKYPNDIDNYI